MPSSWRWASCVESWPAIAGGEADRRRLPGLDAEIENAARLAARVGAIEAVARVVDELVRERCEILARLATRRTEPVEIDGEQLLQIAKRWTADARATLEGSPEDCRRGFEALLGGRRMRVLADDERHFRVEGLFDVPWMREAPSESVDSRGGITGSGGVQSPVRVDLRAARRGRAVGGMSEVGTALRRTRQRWRARHAPHPGCRRLRLAVACHPSLRGAVAHSRPTGSLRRAPVPGRRSPG